MKPFTFILLILISIPMSAQLQQTFFYEITLHEAFKHRSMWTEREEQIQHRHLEYLDSLSKKGHLQLAGIAEQGFDNQKGFVILQTSDYAEAKEIALNDPSVKEGIMSVNLKPIHIYFRREKK